VANGQEGEGEEQLDGKLDRKVRKHKEEEERGGKGNGEKEDEKETGKGIKK